MILEPFVHHPSLNIFVCSHQHPLCIHTHHPFLPWMHPHCSAVKVTSHLTLTSSSFRSCASSFGSRERPSPTSRRNLFLFVARADPRFHRLTGRAGVAQGYGLSQHHTIRVAPRPGHVPPLHGLLSDTQSEYTLTLLVFVFSSGQCEFTEDP